MCLCFCLRLIRGVRWRFRPWQVAAKQREDTHRATLEADDLMMASLVAPSTRLPLVHDDAKVTSLAMVKIKVNSAIAVAELKAKQLRFEVAKLAKEARDAMEERLRGLDETDANKEPIQDMMRTVDDLKARAISQLDVVVGRLSDFKVEATLICVRG